MQDQPTTVNGIPNSTLASPAPVGSKGASRFIDCLCQCWLWIRLAVPYLYLLRVQLLTLAALISLPWWGLHKFPSLLRGLFDVRPMGMTYVTLAAFLTSWTIMVTLWLVLLYGWRRFSVKRLNVVIPTKRKHAPIFFAVLALPVVIGTFYESIAGGTSSFWPLAGYGLLGLAIAVLMLFAGGQFASAPGLNSGWFARMLLLFGRGFRVLDPDANPILLEGHILAAWSFLLCLAAYASIGLAKFVRLGDDPGVPTLAYLLLLMMIICWGFSAVTFILDRYRVPVLLLLLAWSLLTNLSLYDTDHYFHMLEAQPFDQLRPSKVVRAGKRASTVIVVAASGGGIRAAAWTTRVLTGLEEQARAAFPRDERIFGQSIRLISSVSGGSVGAMYFLNEYDASGEGLPQSQTDLEDAVRRAESSSLDDIAWGLVYPDFFRLLNPNYSDYFKTLDRGEALEAALTREPQNSPSRLSDGLSRWRTGVTSGARPAVVFNASVVETGERLLLSTTDLPPAAGRRILSQASNPQFQGKDLAVVTAARLSASFPFVSPAARPDVAGSQFHVVDGGYTDNYGMATLVEWLDEALSAPDNPIHRVLVVEIRASPSGGEEKPKGTRGWFFQTYAPIYAMLNVRDAGQFSHNEEELDLVKRLGAAHSVDIEDAVFEYAAEDAPLSWHLSPNDKMVIEQEWEQEKSGPCWDTVKHYLDGTPISTPSICAARK